MGQVLRPVLDARQQGIFLLAIPSAGQSQGRYEPSFDSCHRHVSNSILPQNRTRRRRAPKSMPPSITRSTITSLAPNKRTTSWSSTLLPTPYVSRGYVWCTWRLTTSLFRNGWSVRKWRRTGSTWSLTSRKTATPSICSTTASCPRLIWRVWPRPFPWSSWSMNSEPSSLTSPTMYGRVMISATLATKHLDRARCSTWSPIWMRPKTNWSPLTSHTPKSQRGKKSFLSARTRSCRSWAASITTNCSSFTWKTFA